jgi:prophage antirepressor-like protein
VTADVRGVDRSRSKVSGCIQIRIRDTLDAIERDGKVWVSLRRCCETLGLDLSTQLRKLKAKAWASVVEMTIESPGEGKR